MTIRDFLKFDPLSDEYVLPKGETPKDLTRLLLARQKLAFNETILETSELTYRILQRNFKLLLKKYSIDDLKRGIELSVRWGDYPGSTKAVESAVEHYLLMKGRN